MSEKNKVFHNEERCRYYGIRVGDRVRHVHGPKGEEKFRDGEVVDLGFMDNNRVVVQWDEGNKSDFVAEWLIVMIPVERWYAGKQGGTIVTKDPFGQPPMSDESMAFYGGYVISESVPTPFINVILAAQPMREALEMIQEMDLNLWSDKRQKISKALSIARYGHSND